MTFFCLLFFPLLNLVELLHNHGAGSTATVADGSNAILTGLQLVQQGHQDTRARAAESVAQGDGAAQGVDAGVFQAQDLSRLEYDHSGREMK